MHHVLTSSFPTRRSSDLAHDAANGTDLKADIASEIHIPAGTTASISTGLTIAVPAGLEAQARASSSLPDGLLVQRLRAAAIGERQEIQVVVSTEIGKASCRERGCQYV